MRKFVTTVCLSVFLLSISILFININAHASPESQSLVDEGRALLFNNGIFTYPGILSANEKFQEAITADPTDQEANFFYAVLRLLTSALAQGSGGSLETIRDVFEACGMSRNSINCVGDGFPYRNISEIDELPNLPETMPDGDQVGIFFSGPFLALLDGALQNLNVITDPFHVTITALELGDVENLEVDYGDVLLLKSFLCFLKSYVRIITAYNLDAGIRELVALANADILTFQRDLLDKYPDLLKRIPISGQQSLNNAKAELLSCITFFGAALDSIEGESDDQWNDLFFFEEAEELNDARQFQTMLNEVRDSLNENRPADFSSTEEEWIFTDQIGNQIEVRVEKDLNGNFSEGDFYALNGWPNCDFVACEGVVDLWSEQGSLITVEMSEASCQVDATLNGLFSPDRQVITGNSFFVTSNCEPDRSGSFSGARQSLDSDTLRVDFNRIFGNTDKAPLDIRDILPEFDQYNEIIAGTFPPTDDSSPVLNGIFPDIQTNDDLTFEMGLLRKDIPHATIIIDGVYSDWSMHERIYLDFDDADCGDVPGWDIQEVYLSQDDVYYYLRFVLNGPLDETFGYKFGEDLHIYVGQSGGVGYISYAIPYPGFEIGYEIPNMNLPSNFVHVNSNQFECKFYKNDVRRWIGEELSAWCDQGFFTACRDHVDLIDLQPQTASISGVITCSSCTSDNYTALAFDGPDPDTSNLIGSAMANPGGTYFIDGIPIGENVYLIATWDSDGNGIIAAGDYWGSDGPYAVPENGISGASFGITNEISGTFISGEVTCNDFQFGLGRIYISALNGSDPNTDGVVATVSISEPGPYTIENLNVGDEVWLAAYWDANGSGASGADFGDYTGGYVGNPVILSSEGNTGINLRVGNPFAGAFGSVSSDPAYSCLLDFDGDGDVDGSDLAEMAGGFE